jgi:hypothetical protein
MFSFVMTIQVEDFGNVDCCQDTPSQFVRVPEISLKNNLSPEPGMRSVLLLENDLAAS